MNLDAGKNCKNLGDCLYFIYFSFVFDTPIFSIGFLIHLIPSLVLVIALIIAWKKKIGGIIFIILFLISILFFSSYKNVWSFLLVSFPLLVIGLLFYL